MIAYLDHASTSPLRPAALAAMEPFLREHFGDPGRLHTPGRTTRVAVETAREQVADFVAARPREVVFCASGTEAINHALWGVVGRVVTTAVEHSAVHAALERRDGDVVTVGVDGTGRVDRDAAVDTIRGGDAVAPAAFVSVQLANHEVGTVHELGAIIEAAHAVGAVVHVDACAAIGYVPISFRQLGADLMSITAHKFGGPLGVGALVIRRGLRVPSLVVGGAQERGRRAGMENVPAIVGFGATCGVVDIAAEATRSRALVDRAWQGISAISGVRRFGTGDLPNVLCLGVDGVEAEPILLGLDQHGVAVHSGSACSSETWEPSPVLEAMGIDAQHSLRASVGWTSTMDDVDRFVDAFAVVVDRLRALR